MVTLEIENKIMKFLNDNVSGIIIDNLMKNPNGVYGIVLSFQNLQITAYLDENYMFVTNKYNGDYFGSGPVHFSEGFSIKLCRFVAQLENSPIDAFNEFKGLWD